MESFLNVNLLELKMLGMGYTAPKKHNACLYHSKTKILKNIQKITCNMLKVAPILLIPSTGRNSAI